MQLSDDDIELLRGNMDMWRASGQPLSSADVHFRLLAIADEHSMPMGPAEDTIEELVMYW